MSSTNDQAAQPSTDPPELADFDSLWDYQNPAQSEQSFRALLPAAESANDPDLHAQLLTQIARARGLQRRFDDAHATLDQAEALLSENTPAARVRCLLERGRVLNSSGRSADSRPPFRQAYDRATEHPALAFHAVDAAHMLGIMEEPAEALQWNERAIAAAERSNDPRTRKWLGPLYNNTGWTYHDQGDFTRALALFEKARDWHEQHGNTTTIRVAHWTVARCYRSLNRLDEALTIQRRLEKQWDADGRPDGYVYEEIAELLLAKEQSEQAKPHFAKAYELLSKDDWLMSNEAERVTRMGHLGGVIDKPPHDP